MQKFLNLGKSLMTGLSKKIFSMKVGVYVYFDLAKDQLGQVNQDEKICEV